MGGGSSSKSSRGRVRFRHNDQFDKKVITYENHAITSGFGYDLLSRSGWVEGQSLGARRLEGDGETKPIPIVVRTTRAGIGSPTASSASSASSVDEDVGNDSAENHDYSLAFDPLRPRCRYDPNHVCASLKALQKHERNCPANRDCHHEEGEFHSDLLIDETTLE